MVHDIENVFSKTQDYNCFACGPNHPFGLKLKFKYDDVLDEVFTQIVPQSLYAGFPGILHGGLQATILDDLAFWGAWVKYQRSGFTFDLKIRYKRKCPVDRLIEGRVKVGGLNHNLVDADVRLIDPVTTELFTKGTVRYYLPDQDPRTQMPT